MSRFVSAGTGVNPPERSDEWLKAQQEIDATRQATKLKEGRQEDGKTLYEVLQANKAAKQEAFEESIRLKNQFRSLDEDEVDFLDSVLESTRAKDAAVKKDTAEQLELFRKQQEEAGREALVGQSSEVALEDETQWQFTARKRKRTQAKDTAVPAKLQKLSSTASDKHKADTSKLDSSKTEGSNPTSQSSTTSGPPKAKPSSATTADSKSSSASTALSSAPNRPVSSALGLADYSSDDDE